MVQGVGCEVKGVGCRVKSIGCGGLSVGYRVSAAHREALRVEGTRAHESPFGTVERHLPLRSAFRV